MPAIASGPTFVVLFGFASVFGNHGPRLPLTVLSTSR
ncbi:hypothetical protein JOF29_008021 [Kribbella aluminosa]|uniref:Uncharacterized protein n=1 Tax=Kribbella aluminosa TaxID=416017 RepID=A0ABS4UZ30_9ACTN|nr:hypothetical protein [Kribbella aluminosa]